MKLQIILIKKLNYLGKGLSAEEATRLKEQRIKEDNENDTECGENVILGKYGKLY